MSASFLIAANRRAEDGVMRPESRIDDAAEHNPLLRPSANLMASHAAIIAELNAIVDSHSTTSKKRPWHCQVAPSLQRGAGDGVFVRGATCPAGHVLAAYPGVTYQTEDLTMMHKLVLPGNDYVIFRRDGVLIDGRADGPSSQMWEMAERRERAAGKPPLSRDDRSNELAIGNMVNHPPSGSQPNVIVHPLDLASGEQLHLHQHLPVVNFRPPAEGEPSKRTVVLISVRDIAEGEELLLDYKLQADGSQGSWYVPVVYPDREGSKSLISSAGAGLPTPAASPYPSHTCTSDAVARALPAASAPVTMSSNIGRTPPSRFSGTGSSFHSARGGNL